MSKHIAICCLAVAFLASAPLTRAQPLVFGAGFAETGKPNDMFPNGLGGLPPGVSSTLPFLTPESGQQIYQAAGLLPEEPEPAAVPQSAPVTQNFIQLAQPEVEAPAYASYSPSAAFSEPQMQPDLGDSEVSEDDAD